MIAARDVPSGLCGYVDQQGVFVIKPVFVEADSFAEGLARVLVVKEKREMVGFIDSTGKFVIEPKFDVDYDVSRRSTNFSIGLASVVMPMLDAHRFIRADGSAAFVAPYFQVEPFHDGLSSVFDGDTGLYGFIDKQGNVVIEPKYSMASSFPEGRAFVESK